MAYKVPEGYYDLPFTWLFNANSLNDGQDYLNQAVYVQGGYGTFILRRIVGLSNVLGTTGRFRVYDASRQPLQATPVYVNSAPVGLEVFPLDLGLSHEVVYPETSVIRFDLYGISKAAAPGALIAFEGVRRMKGSPPQNRNFQAKEKTFIYQQDLIVSPTAGQLIFQQEVIDFDFELYDIRLLSEGLPLSAPVALLWIRDRNKVAIASEPNLDLYCDGNPNGIYRDGAIVPPLYYRKDGQIQIDVVSVQNPMIAPQFAAFENYVAAFPETVTMDPAIASAAIFDGTPFYWNGAFYCAAFDGTPAINIFKSPDGVTWTPFTPGPTLEGLVTSEFKTALVDNELRILYADAGGFVAYVAFDLVTETWGTVTTTANLAGTQMGDCVMVDSGDTLTLFASSGAVQTQYCIFNVLTLTITPWVDCGPAIYMSSWPLGIVKGTNGRVHLIGRAVDFVLIPDHVWQQTLYPATDTLLADSEITTATGPDDTNQQVCVSNGLIMMWLTPDGTNFDIWTGESADTIAFASQPAPPLPGALYRFAAFVANDAGAVLFAQQDTAGVLTYQYRTFDGTSFSDWNLMGTSAYLSTFGHLYKAAANTSGGVSFWGLNFTTAGPPHAGYFFWGFTALSPRELTIQLVGRQMIPC